MFYQKNRQKLWHWHFKENGEFDTAKAELQKVELKKRENVSHDVGIYLHLYKAGIAIWRALFRLRRQKICSN